MTKDDVHQRQERRFYVTTIDLFGDAPDEPWDVTIDELEAWLLQRVKDAVQRVRAVRAPRKKLARFTYCFTSDEQDDPAPSILVCGHRLENDREYKERIEAYEQTQIRTQQEAVDLEAAQRAIYERLKAKYE